MAKQKKPAKTKAPKAKKAVKKPKKFAKSPKKHAASAPRAFGRPSGKPKGKGKVKVELGKPSFVRLARVVPPKSSGLIITRSANLPPETNEKPLSASEVQKFRTILQQKREDLAQVVARKKEMEFQEVEPEIGDEADIATASV